MTTRLTPTERGGDTVGRDDEAVTSDHLDTPWAPPGASTHQAGENDGADRTEPQPTKGDGGVGSGIELPFDSVREAAAWWYGPVTESRTWLALAYLFVGAVLGPILFGAMTLILVLTGSLTLIAVGLLLVIPAFGAINALAELERRRAAWVLGAPMPARELSPPGRGFWPRVAGRLSDPARWRQVAYLAAVAVAGPVLFTVGSAPWFLLVQLTTGTGFGNFNIAGLIVAGLFLGAAPRVTTFVADVATSFTAWFVAPDPSSALEERVEELSTQREQILDAVASERRRIERNLHDGVQQQLVALGIDIGRAEARIESDPEGAKQLLGEAREKVRGSIGELRMIGRGLHPAVLSDRGLDAALSAVVSTAPIPISVSVTTSQDLTTDVAETAYYVVNEAVANVLKHAKARSASIRVDDEPGLLPAIRITVHDDGLGGASPIGGSGSGLAGIIARVRGVDGAVDIDSPPGGPTVLTAVVPLKPTTNVEGGQ